MKVSDKADSVGQLGAGLIQVFPLALGRPWPTIDPFLFCAHHRDFYPAGNGSFGPASSLSGRRIGMDFEGKDGWNMYHGDRVPGFPSHPHRGFETVTVVRTGRLDHADSMGASARYGDGDVQWLTAGSGIQHSEMMPLLSEEHENPLELFQIWLNLPQKSKMATPSFKMFWADSVPTKILVDSEGREARVTIRAGRLGETQAPSPPPDSWASDTNNEVSIWTVELEPGAEWTMPTASAGVARAIYFFEGSELFVNGRKLSQAEGATLDATELVRLKCGAKAGQILMLQGRPIGEPVAHQGPFVMNTQEELRQAFADYRQTAFGGWPWPSSDPVHGADPGRFARDANGQVERPKKA